MSQPNNFNEQVISEFRANHGKVGGPFEGLRCCCCTRPARAAASRGSAR